MSDDTATVAAIIRKGIPLMNDPWDVSGMTDEQLVTEYNGLTTVVRLALRQGARDGLVKLQGEMRSGPLMRWGAEDVESFTDEEYPMSEKQAQTSDIPPAPSRTRDVLPSEALFGFAAWLTCRREVAGPFSAAHNAAQAAELVAAFCKSQEWEQPRDTFPSMLKDYPEATPAPSRTLAHVVADLAAFLPLAFNHPTERTSLSLISDLAAEAQRIAEGT